MHQQISKHVKERFQQRFGTEPLLVRSPGRVNVIGEHTDYNNGFVLPAAIDKAIYIGVSRREDNEIVLYSEEFKQEHRSTVPGVAITDKQWPNYILGVVDQLNKRGHTISGFNLNIDGDVPVGAGLSSSAAVECATAFALNELFALGIDKMELATCSGSSGSTARGIPVLTLQKAQARVQVSPRIITVACFLVQHSPIFGQAASSHTVARLSSRISLRVSL
jgi:galactokinase